MKKVAPKARSFDNESPLTAAAIACSRMPKCRFLPPGVPGSKSPAPSNVKVVLLDEPRSADPPMSQGMFCGSADLGSSNKTTLDRKSTRLNSSHQIISYTVFCFKKKKHSYTYS